MFPSTAVSFHPHGMITCRRSGKGFACRHAYTPAEKEYGLTAQALEVIERFRFPVHITTKSDLITRDIEILKAINRVRASVSFTLTTTDDDLARKVEPGAPLPSRRSKAMAQPTKPVLKEHSRHTSPDLLIIMGENTNK